MTDLRTVSFDVPPQEILTKDSVTVNVDAVVYYKIKDPMAAVCNVSDYAKSTKLLASTTLRTILGTKILSELLSDREIIAKDILAHLDGATDPWGILVRVVVRLMQWAVLKYIFSKIEKLTFACNFFFKLFRLKGLKSKMSDYPSNCKEQWQLRLKLQEKQELK